MNKIDEKNRIIRLPEKLREIASNNCNSAEARLVLNQTASQIEQYRREIAELRTERGAMVADFMDFALSGVPNLAPYCANGSESCIDERGWCMEQEQCKGFYPQAARSKQWRGMEVEG